MLFANVCEGFIRFCHGEFWERRFLGFLASLLCLVCLEFWWSPCCVQDLGYIGVPPAGHALWAEVGVGITFVTSGENNLKVHKTAYKYLGIFVGFIMWEPIYASLSGTAQSPWLSCMYGLLD